MDAQQEMYSLQEIFEVIKQMTGFSGDIMMQAATGERYTEQKGIDAILKHIHSGGRADSEIIREELAGGFEKLLRNARVPYAGFEVTSETGEKQRLYTFRDGDRSIVREVINEMKLPDFADIQRSQPNREQRLEPER